MQLISSPARAWEEIRLEEDRRKVFTAFVYPMIGLCGLSVFIGALLLKGWGGPQSFQYAMTQCCAVAVSLLVDISWLLILLITCVCVCWECGVILCWYNSLLVML